MYDPYSPEEVAKKRAMGCLTVIDGTVFKNLSKKNQREYIQDFYRYGYQTPVLYWKMTTRRGGPK